MRLGLRNLGQGFQLQPRSKFGSQEEFVGLPYVPGRWGKTSIRLKGQSSLSQRYWRASCRDLAWSVWRPYGWIAWGDAQVSTQALELK